MTELRLASVNGTRTADADIASAARAFAEQVESGSLNAERAIVVAVIDGRIDFTCFGPSPTIAEGIGLLELAKARVIEGAWV